MDAILSWSSYGSLTPFDFREKKEDYRCNIWQDPVLSNLDSVMLTEFRGVRKFDFRVSSPQLYSQHAGSARKNGAEPNILLVPYRECKRQSQP